MLLVAVSTPFINTMIQIRSILLLLFSCSSIQLYSSWPQWRGAFRNGVAPDSPPLTTEFPEEGPKLLWESFEIPSDDDGGHSSLVIEGDKVYLSLVWHRDVPSTERTISSKVLRTLGHRNTNLSKEKLAIMERARLERSPRLRGSKLEEWMNLWIEENLNEKEKLHYSGFIKSRLKQGKFALPLDLLDAVAQKKDTVFPDHETFVNWVKSNNWPDDLAQKVIDAVPATMQQASDTVLCLDAKSGKEIWRFEKETTPVGRNAASTPCIADGKVFAVGAYRAYCLNADSGKVLWDLEIKNKGPAASPLYAEGKFFLLDSGLKALNAENGEEMWLQKKVNNKNASPVAWGKAKALTIACQGSAEFIGVNGNTGEIRWEVSGGGDSTAAIDQNLVAVQNQRSDSGLVVHRITEDRIEKIWEHLYTSRRYSSSPLVFKDKVYLLGASRHLCADLKTGKILWNQPAKSEISSPILADGKLFVLENNGALLTVLDANAEEYTELARTKIRAMRCPSPAISDGLLFVRKADKIACFDLRKQ